MVKTCYLIIGSGVAGLSLAIKLAERFPERDITMVTKAGRDESNTKYAQGGVAVVQNEQADSFQKHIEDTLVAGDGLCDIDIVKMVITEGPKRLDELIQWGANFDFDATGHLDLGREGGHSEYRVVHHKDITGFEVERALLSRVDELPNIEILSFHFAIDLITQHQVADSFRDDLACFGAYVLDQKSGEVKTIHAENTILATGGIGKVYGHTTNPEIATGDGIAMAYRAKAKISDMEFVQFHPTGLYDGREGRTFLISEAVRGFGAFLRNKAGNRFMLDYDPRAELAPRDIVSQSIDAELKKTGESHVFLDCTHLPIDDFKAHFPNIYQACLTRHIDIAKDWIPVVPAAHYLCGGIDVNTEGRTTISHLFACGECSRTGLHGANRLASNSLLEALVYSHNIFKYLAGDDSALHGLKIAPWNDEGTVMAKEQVVVSHNLNQLQALMRNYVGIVRSDDRLRKAIKQLDLIYEEVEELYKQSKVTTAICELRNMVNVAHLIIGQSIERKVNKGGFVNVDNSK